MTQRGIRTVIRLTVGAATGAALIALQLWPAGMLADAGSAAFDRGMQPVLASYLKIQEQLAKDSVDGTETAASALAQAATRLDTTSVTGEHAAHYKDVPTNLQSAAEALAKARNVGTAREAFKQLSQPMAMWATMSHPDGVDVVYCTMAKASWLQKHGAVRNPYYGAGSLRCGEVQPSSNQPAAMGHEHYTDEHHVH